MLGVSALAPDDRGVAERIARALDLTLLDDSPAARDLPEATLFIEVASGIPRLRLGGRRSPGPVAVGFEGQALAQRRAAGHNELLGRAVGWRARHAPRVVDATAGFGQDAFVLADLGCEVLLCERNPVMICLLEEALRRAGSSEDAWLRAVSARMRLQPGDASRAGDLPQTYDVIYLDPMFRAQRKTAPSKSMQLLQRLLEAEGNMGGESTVGASGAALARGADWEPRASAKAGAADGTDPDNEDGAALLDWALRQPVRRVVVKRPRRAAPLPGRDPAHALSGRAVRFDVYPLTGS